MLNMAGMGRPKAYRASSVTESAHEVGAAFSPISAEMPIRAILPFTSMIHGFGNNKPAQNEIIHTKPV